MQKNNKIMILAIIILIFNMLLPFSTKALEAKGRAIIKLPSEIVHSDVAIWKLPNEDEKELFEKLKDKDDNAIKDLYGNFLQKQSPLGKEKITFENLEVGTYFIKQLDSEEKGKRLVPLVFKINTSNEEITITGKSINSEPIKSSFKFVKVDKDTKQPLQGAVFDILIKKDASYTLLKKELVSNEKGEFIIDDIEVGSYYLREVKAPSGYKKLEYNIPFDVVDNKDNNYLEVVNEKIPSIDVPYTGDTALILALIFGTSIFILGFLIVKRDSNKP